MGLEFKSTYNLATGSFLNPERSLPSNGQASMGLTWTLGQGLMIDERRAELRSAREGIGMGRAERQLVLNNLLYQAGKLYWEWALNTNELRVLQAALSQAQLRHNALRESAIQGDKPFIDTLETFIQVQNRVIEITFATNQLKNSQIELGTYFWGANQRQVPLQDNLDAPSLTGLEAQPAFANKEATELVDDALESHPSLSFYGAKIRQLAIEKQFKTEKLKPVLDLDYHILGRGWEFSPSPGENGAAVVINGNPPVLI
jgi:outer membrane protein TolC